MKFLLSSVVCCSLLCFAAAVRPLVFIHGLTDTYTSFSQFQGYLEADFPGIKVFSLDAYNGEESFKPLQEQIPVFAEMVKNITDEYGDITLVGHSQGAVISRAILQTTGNPHIHTLISLAAPAMGTFGIPNKNGTTGLLGLHVTSIVSKLCYGNNLPPLVRAIARKTLTDRFDGKLSLLLEKLLSGEEVSFCAYWKDPTPLFYPKYLEYSPILPYLNNELDHENSELYKKNFLGIQKLVLVGGPSDDVVKPWQSSQYTYYDEDVNVINKKDYNIYKEDTFGLKTLDERNDLSFCTVFSLHHNFFHVNRRVYEKCVKPHVE